MQQLLELKREFFSRGAWRVTPVSLTFGKSHVAIGKRGEAIEKGRRSDIIGI